MVLAPYGPARRRGRGEGFALRAQPRSPKQPGSRVARRPPGGRDAGALARREPGGPVTGRGEVRTGRERITRSRPVFVWPSWDCRACARASVPRGPQSNIPRAEFFRFPVP